MTFLNLLRTVFATLAIALTAAAAQADPEVHGVGVYEGAIRTGDTIHGSEAEVLVDRPGAEVTLVLGSFEPVRWNVRSSPGTHIARVLVHGRDPARSKVVVNGATFPFELAPRIRYVYASQGRPFRDYVLALTGEDGATGRLDSFHGAYRAPKDGFVIDSSDPDNANFSADPSCRLTARPEVVPETLRTALSWHGPDPDPQLVLKSDGFRLLRTDGQWIEHPVSLDVPRISWPVAGVNAGRGRLFGVTLGGEGFLYGYDTGTRSWTVVRSMRQRDASGMIYDEARDRLVILISGLVGGPAIQFQDLSSGQVIELPIELEDFPGITDLIDPGNGPGVSLTPVAISGDLLLLHTAGDWPNSRPRSGSRSYLLDTSTGEVTLVDYREPVPR